MKNNRKPRQKPVFDSQFEEIEYYKAMVLNYIGYRMRSRKEISDYLRKKECPEAMISDILVFLEEYRFVDDRQFAENYRKDARQLQHRSRKEIVYQLRQKGIDPELISDVMEEESEEEEEAQLRKLVEKKLRASGTPDLKKIAASLMRKGYSYSVIRRVIGDCQEIFDE